jgi:hypothetical protein
MNLLSDAGCALAATDGNDWQAAHYAAAAGALPSLKWLFKKDKQVPQGHCSRRIARAANPPSAPSPVLRSMNATAWRAWRVGAASCSQPPVRAAPTNQRMCEQS